MKYKAHPWHGISAGKKAPKLVTCFIEVVPGDEMKYEVDKESGYLMIDRPNKFSNILPALYGFIPQTYSAEACANYCMKQSGLSNIEGDGDPIDIVVLTDRKVPHGDLLLEAIPVGGFRMIDGGEADDKIVAVLKGDSTYGDIKEMSDLPEKLIKRIKHYFLTYKEHPDTLGKQAPKVEITQEYGQEEAFEVIKAGQKDYLTHYGQKEMA
ncbi:inorganic pyrophosphatase [Saprospira sp. CCB-QB6]|uniref:inorganic pyrophosphatase n=1 Tax=Saprospira sp. CCB-QB6 TaxID=3023936 RepID=UPI002349A8B9|nr:inorganic pyrophosphatase [Saprospira sp. CCB-QB6]WCL80062.1 inorganic pyrophosphatase [Saprospira sp. CCB-QB6]